MLCHADSSCPVEFRFIRRNQFLMENEEICHYRAKYGDLLSQKKVKLVDKNGKALASMIVKVE